MPTATTTDASKTFLMDLRRVHERLLSGKAPGTSEVLSPFTQHYLSGSQSYWLVDDFTVMHVMDYEALQPYRVSIQRPDFICIQITIAGKYSRLTTDRTHKVHPATTHITNFPASESFLKPGQRLRGLWIACDRKKFLSHYGVRIDRVPSSYRPIFASEGGMPNGLELPTLASNVVAIEQVLGCRLDEPLHSRYVHAKAVEIICNVAAQIQTRAVILQNDALSPHEAIDAAAEIYRRTLSDPPTVDDLAFRVGLNRNELNAGFRARFGMTPHAYNVALRMKEANSLLRGGAFSISDVARRVGYASFASFSRAYSAFHGSPPSTSRRSLTET